MERLEGTVTALTYTRHPIGRGRPGRPVPVVHIYRFVLSDRTVEVRHGAALPLNDGDTVTAVCRVRGGIHRAYAWANRTWGARLVEPRGMAAAMRGWLPMLPAGLFYGLAAALWSNTDGPLARTGTAFLAVVATGLALLAARGFIEYARYRRAARLLDI